jgi:hypothetical protein
MSTGLRSWLDESSVAGHRRYGYLAGVLKHSLCPLGVALGLIPDRLEAVDAVLEGGVVDIGNTLFNGVVKALQSQVRFRRAFAEFGDMRAATLALLVTSIENGGKDGLQPVGSKQPLLQLEPPRFYRRAKLLENCPLWNRHKGREPRSRIRLSSASVRCGWRWNTAMSISLRLRR